MATYYWIGGADAVAQAATVEITAFDAATTYTLTAGDASASVAGNASANQTATDLAAAWEALTHAHATAVSANATAANITLAAVTAGTSFSVTTVTLPLSFHWLQLSSRTICTEQVRGFHFE